jgi:4-hydroxybenzoate polyprenyltransferase
MTQVFYISAMKIKQLIPTRSALAHLRFVFSVFLFPVFLFALSQTPIIHIGQVGLVFFIWHFLAFPASNGYNSYFDKDEESIGLLEKPPRVDISLYYFSLLLEITAFTLGLFVNWYFAVAVLIYGIMSKLYSHPATRLKKYPIISFLTVFFFQGAFIYWSTYFAFTDLSPLIDWPPGLFMAGVICSCLIGASYPLTQVYQHAEDSRRGDRTISLLLGYKGSFILSGALFAMGMVLMILYWYPTGSLLKFYVFLGCAAPIFLFFNWWFYKVGQDTRNANFTNAMRMNYLSAACMIGYFAWLVWMW